MNLDEFISETIKGIIKGISDTASFSEEYGSKINPKLSIFDKQRNMMMDSSGETRSQTITNIDFDIAVTASNQSDKSAKGGINVLSLSVGGAIADKAINETVSRIKFSINVCMPNVES